MIPLKTWDDLEKQGVKRCRAIDKNGKRCRRRASEKYGFSWCTKHGPAMKRHTANAALQAQQEPDDNED
jgi:hypothetical protein